MTTWRHAHLVVLLLLPGIAASGIGLDASAMDLPERRAAGSPIVSLPPGADAVYAGPGAVPCESFTPNDPFFAGSLNYQWNFNNIGMKKAWDINPGGSPSTIIAVLDTGVAYEDYRNFRLAPDLAGTNFVPGYDFVRDDAHPNDTDSHGTHVAGTIAQTTNNDIGAAGIAFNCSIMPVSVLSRKGVGSFTDLADGIVYAADHGAKVINMSLSSSVESSVVTDAVDYAWRKGVTMVAATGNDNEVGSNAIGFPARDPRVIAVGATRYDNAVAWYSNGGSQLDLVAPGGDLSVDQNGDGNPDGILQNTFNPNTRNTRDFGYWLFEGSSMAAPHVAAVAALIYDTGVDDPDVVRAILINTAVDLGPPGFDEPTGHGLLNAEKALTLAVSLQPGDANVDQRVDGGDLALWQQNYDPLGSNPINRFSIGDWNADNCIDGGDLALWQQNYDPLGPTASDADPMTPIPEPATLFLIGQGALTLVVITRRGRD